MTWWTSDDEWRRDIARLSVCYDDIRVPLRGFTHEVQKDIKAIDRHGQEKSARPEVVQTSRGGMECVVGGIQACEEGARVG